MRTSRFSLVQWSLLSAILIACGGETIPAGGGVDLREAARVIVEVDYMPSAAPSMVPLSSGARPWLFFQKNLIAMLPQSIEALSYPRKLAEMGNIEATKGSVFTREEVLGLAAAHRDLKAGPMDAHFHVLFLDGSYAEAFDEELRAVHIEGSRVIALFGGAGAKGGDLDVLLEQSALIHEFGHAIGLVSLEVPDISGHSDGEEKGHCNVAGCVMGATATVSEEMIVFATEGPVPMVIGDKCLADLEAYFDTPLY